MRSVVEWIKIETISKINSVKKIGRKYKPDFVILKTIIKVSL